MLSGTVTPMEPVTSCCLMVEQPLRLNDTLYVPGGRLTMLNWPRPSVTTDRDFSIRTGLEVSTTTPGRTASDASFTAPAIEPSACACSAVGVPRSPSARMNNPAVLLMTCYCGAF